MHAVFMLYGIKQAVDHFLMDLQAQKFTMRVFKEGEKDRSVWIQGNLRVCPFGVYEYAFPKEHMGMVLTTLGFHKPEGDRYQLGKARLFGVRKLFKAEKIPEFDTSQVFIWTKDNVAIIPIGVRYDVDLTEKYGEAAGWTHEAI